MKNLIILIFLLFSKLSFGQFSDTLILYINDNSCGSVNFNILYYFENTDTVVLNLDFGNGTDTTFMGDFSGEYTYPYNGFTSIYVYSGNYTVELTAKTTSGTVLDQQSYNFAIAGGEGCSEETIYKTNNDFSIFYSSDSIPMDFTGNDGITHTIFPTTLYSNHYLTNPLLYPAQISISSSWLAANNRVQLHPPLDFSAPHMIQPEDMYFGLGWPVIITSRTDIPNLNNSIHIPTVLSYYLDTLNPINVSLGFNNTTDAIPDSVNRIRVEYDPFLNVTHDSTLLNMTEGIGFIEFDVELLNLYQSIPFSLTASSVQSLDSIYFRAFYVNNSDQNTQDDTTSLFLQSIDPCAGMTDSVLNVSLESSFNQYGSNQLHSYLTLSKNICQEVDSIGLTIHYSPILEADIANAGFQFSQINDSTLHTFVTLQHYMINQTIYLPFTSDDIPPGFIYVNYSIDLQDFELADNFTGDTINFAVCDSVDVSLSSLSAVMIAPLEAGNCSVSPLILSTCLLADSAELLITFPGYVTMDSAALALGTFTDSTLHIIIDWTNQYDYFQIPFHIPGTIPSATPYSITAKLVINNDVDTTNNTIYYEGFVLNSYDPNEKHADLPSNLNPNLREKITYTIHFQNDGNLEAYNIEVHDTLSTNLDISTFQFLGSSHHCDINVDLTTREVVFRFPNIMLPSSELDSLGSQGIFSYQISENNNLPVGSVIENTAYIYFDFNPAIVTNTTYNINQEPLGLEDSKLEAIYMYPNPAADKIQFSGASIREVAIYDMAGKQVLEVSNILNNEVSLNNLQSGIYQVILKSENSISNQKLVIKK